MSSDESEVEEGVKRTSWRRLLLVDGFFLLLFLFAAVVTWFATGVRDIGFLSSYIESEIERQAPGLDVTFGTLYAGIFPEDNALIIDVDKLRLRAKDNGVNMALPKARLKLDTLKLLTGNVHLSELEIFSPVLQFRKAEDGSLALEMREGEALAAPTTTAGEFSIKSLLNSPMLAIADAIRMHNVNLFLLDQGKRTEILIPDLHTSFQRQGEPKIIKLSADFTGGGTNVAENKGTFDATLKLNSVTGEVKGNVSTAGFDLGALNVLSPELAPLAGLSLPVNMKGEFYRVKEGTPYLAKLVIEGKDGKMESDEFAAALPIDALRLEITVPDGLSAFAIKELAVKTGTVQLNGSGTLSLSEQGPSGEFDLTAENMAVNDLEKYWPVRLAPQSRTWVTQNIQAGHVPHAEARIVFSASDLEQDVLPDSFIKASVEVKGATVKYLPQMPLVTDADVTAHFTGTTMDVDLHKGKTFKATAVDGGKFSILDFNDIITPAKLSVTMTTTAEDALTALDKNHMNIGQSLSLDPATAKGTIKGTLELEMPLFPEDGGLKQSTFDLTKYNIKADIQNASLQKIRKKWDVQDMTGTFSATNKEILIKGNGQLQGQKAVLDVRYDQPTGIAEYHLNGNIPVEGLKAFEVSLPEQVELSGLLGADVTMKEKKGGDEMKATLDLKSARMAVPEINWSKENGIPATMTIAYKRTPKTIELPEIMLQANDASVKGSATLDNDGELVAANVQNFRYKRNDFAATYKKETAVKVVSISGKALDVSAFKDPKSPAENPFKRFEFLNADVNVQNLYISSKDGFKNVRASANCPGTTCISSSITANTSSGKPFTMKLEGQNTKRTIRVDSNDAGQVLSAFDISDHVSGGTLSLTGEYLDDQDGNPLKGRVLITDFAVVKGPVMTKLLSLASLTGFLDTLQGKGISFKKLSANFSMKGDTITVNEGSKAYGSALGIMAEGDIAPFKHGSLDMKGTIVPSYTANSFLGKIPLLGEVLVGGKDQGIIAARFTVKGTSENPNVSVNPLSLLTPGFLRNMFDVFDAPKGAKDDGSASKTVAPVQESSKHSKPCDTRNSSVKSNRIAKGKSAC